MRKQAVLIGCRKKGEEKMQSFENDVNFFKSLLNSVQGGAWLDSEITSFIDPTYEKLLSAFEERVDFRFIYFSGHGCISKNGQQYVHVSGNIININQFLNKSEKEIAIFDCCRTFHPFEELTKKYIVREAKLNFQKTSIRTIYEQFIKKVKGQLVVFVTEKGDFAFTIETANSIFITTLGIILTRIKKLPVRGVVSINKILALVNKEFKNQRLPQQINVIDKCNGKYPFYIGQVPNTSTSKTINGHPQQNLV